ncbi:Low-density lipoprotein receptor domain class A, partial [Trichostrongylus colubriformis]
MQLYSVLFRYDESHCSYLHTCPEGDFICRSGDCVSSHFKCDGEIDCPGGEDERGCEFLSAFVPSASIPTTCPDHMFQCRHGPCIARAYLCDGEADCPLGEDERNCSRSDENPTARSGPAGCDPGMVMCADRTACFPKHWICDGEPDCLDGSDESDCAMSVENFLAETITELCHPGEHRCGGGSKCIPVNRTCDGTLDCPNGDDEGPLCNECEVRRTPCEHKCVNTPSGSRCICPHGSVLNPDEYTCAQKDECSTPEGKQCQHYCEDRHASYRCTCAPGYQLGTDGHS